MTQIDTHNTNNPKLIYPELSYQLVGVLYKADNLLGYGHSEKKICEAITAILKEENISFSEQVPLLIQITRDKKIKYIADYIIDNKIVLEIKVGSKFQKGNFMQLLSYLKSSNYKLGIISVFTPQGVKYKRIVY